MSATVWLVADVPLDDTDTIVGDVEVFAHEDDAARRADRIGVAHWPEHVQGADEWRDRHYDEKHGE